MEVFKAHENDPSGLGIVARIAEALDGEVNGKLLIPGRPDHYEIPVGKAGYYWSTFESDEIPQDWVDKLNYAAEVFVPHESVRKAFINSGVKRPVNVVNQGYTRYKRTRPLDIIQPLKPLRIGILGVPTERKNVGKLIEAVNRLGGAVHLDIQTPWLVTAEQREWAGEMRVSSTTGRKVWEKSRYITLSVGRKTDDEIAEWYSNLDGYIYPSSGEGWSFTPREALAMGIPTILSDIPVHDELMPYVCPITTNLYEDAYYEFLQGTCGKWKHYTVDMITESLIDFVNNYTTYRAKALEGKKWITDKWQWDTILEQLKTEIEPKHLMLCPTRYQHCGIDTYTRELLPYLPDTKYVNSYEQINAVMSRSNVESIHVQHEWGIFSTQQLFMEMNKWDCQKKITMHTVVKEQTLNQQMIQDTFDVVYALTRKGAEKMNGIYVPHGTSLPLNWTTPTTPTVGTFGFIHPQKGYKEVTTAMQQMQGFNLRIVGELDKHNKASMKLYEECIKENKQVQFIDGFFSYEEIYRKLADCRVLVYYYQDVRAFYTSGSILHAARLGIPIICSQTAVFEDLAAGTCQVPPGDPKALSEAINRVALDAGYRAELVTNMNKILNEHLWENVAKRFL